MKKLLLIACIALVSFICSCDSESGGDDSPYYIEFTITDSTGALFASGKYASGPSDGGFESIPSSSVYPSTTSVNCLAAETPVLRSVYITASEFNTMYIFIRGNATDGLQFGGYVITPVAFSLNSAFLYARISNVTYYPIQDGSLIFLNNIEEIGGAVTGSFDGKIYNVALDEATAPKYDISGSFRCKRMPNDMLIQ